LHRIDAGSRAAGAALGIGVILLEGLLPVVFPVISGCVGRSVQPKAAEEIDVGKFSAYGHHAGSGRRILLLGDVEGAVLTYIPVVVEVPLFTRLTLPPMALR
jgi:hypothetical protein